MNIYSILNTIKGIGLGNLLTFTGILLAYVAYSWSIRRDLNSWKSLLISFKADLENQKNWLQGEYSSSETYKDIDSFDPRKKILPLSFESLHEIIRRGVAEFKWLPEKFIDQLSIFNERINAFNSVLEQIKEVVSVDPILTEKLIDKLNILKKDNDFETLKNKISELKTEDETFYLAENIRRLNRIVHIELIGDKGKQDRLHYLYCEIKEKLNFIIDNFDNKRPFFIKYETVLIIISILVFLTFGASFN